MRLSSKDPKMPSKTMMMSSSSLTDFFFDSTKTTYEEPSDVCSRPCVNVCADICLVCKFQTRAASFDEIILYKRISNSKWFEAGTTTNARFHVNCSSRKSSRFQRRQQQKGSLFTYKPVLLLLLYSAEWTSDSRPKIHKVNKKYSAKYMHLYLDIRGAKQKWATRKVPDFGKKKKIIAGCCSFTLFAAIELWSTHRQQRRRPFTDVVAVAYSFFFLLFFSPCSCLPLCSPIECRIIEKVLYAHIGARAHRHTHERETDKIKYINLSAKLVLG